MVGPFQGFKSVSYDAIEVWNQNSKTFKVNARRLKPYLNGELIDIGVFHPLYDHPP